MLSGPTRTAFRAKCGGDPMIDVAMLIATILGGGFALMGLYWLAFLAVSR